MTPLEYCREKAAPAGSNAYYYIYFADPRRQAALTALFALRAEIVEISKEVSDPNVGLVKLNWWREELDRTYAGTARHPVAQALQEPVAEFGLPREPFDDLLAGVEMDLEYGSYPSFSQLAVYCHRTGTAFAQLLATVCGYEDKATLRFAHHLGMGLQLMQQLMHVRRDARRGHIYIPEDELAAAGVARSELLADRTSERLSKLFAQQAERIENFFDQAAEQLPAQDAWAQRNGLILADLDRALLAEMRADGFPLLERAYHLTPIRKLWRAWRTVRRQKSYKRASV